MIYLASPYTDPDPFMREVRYLAAMEKVVQYLKEGKWVYSPIVHCHELAKMVGLGTEFLTWKQYNFHMLDRADEFHILQLDGWDKSVGIAGEKHHWLSRSPDNVVTLVQP